MFKSAGANAFGIRRNKYKLLWQDKKSQGGECQTHSRSAKHSLCSIYKNIEIVISSRGEMPKAFEVVTINDQIGDSDGDGDIIL